MDLTAADSSVTTTRMAHEIGISRNGLDWQIHRLKSTGWLECIGSDKHGRWRVLENDDG